MTEHGGHKSSSMAETKRKGLLFLLKYKKEDTFSKWIYTLNPDAADRIPALRYTVGLGLFGFYTVAALYPPLQARQVLYFGASETKQSYLLPADQEMKY